MLEEKFFFFFGGYLLKRSGEQRAVWVDDEWREDGISVRSLLLKGDVRSECQVHFLAPVSGGAERDAPTGVGAGREQLEAARVLISNDRSQRSQTPPHGASAVGSTVCL